MDRFVFLTVALATAAVIILEPYLTNTDLKGVVTRGFTDGKIMFIVFYRRIT